MPAERVGPVRDAYLWRVLQRRAPRYRALPPAHPYAARVHAALAPPAVAALSAAFEREPAARSLAALERCGALLARLPVDELTLDSLVLTLVKFTGLLQHQSSSYIAIGVSLGQSARSQLALGGACGMVARHGGALRAAWEHVLRAVGALYRGRLLPQSMVEAEDYLSPDGKVSLLPETARGPESGLLSSLYSYIALGETGMRAPTPHERALMDAAAKCVAACNLPALLVTETKFLPLDSLQALVDAMVTVGAPPDAESLQLNPELEDMAVFFLELLGQTLIQNRDRAARVWAAAAGAQAAALRWAAARGGGRAARRVLCAVLRCAARLMRAELCAAAVLQHLALLFTLPQDVFHRHADVISCGLHEVVRTSAQNVHGGAEWQLVLALLCAAGAGVWPADSAALDLSSRSGSEEEAADHELSQSPHAHGWILVEREADPPARADPAVLQRCVETLALVVRDLAHVTPYNCRATVAALRIVARAAMRHGQEKSRDDIKSRSGSSRTRDDSSDEETEDVDQYHLISIQVLDLMHTLHSRTAQIFAWWRDEAEQRGPADHDLWDIAWSPLLQAIALFCTDRRKQVSRCAMRYLQRALLAPGLSSMGGEAWEACFYSVLFPLLGGLGRRPDAAARANTLTCKVLLQHLAALACRPTFSRLWTRMLHVQRSLLQTQHDALAEAALESLKNVILVMDSVHIFRNEEGYNELWFMTWEVIGEFLPTLKQDMFPDVPDDVKLPTNPLSHMQSLPASLPTIVPPTSSRDPVQVLPAQSPVCGPKSPPAAAAPPVSGMVPIRNPLYDQMGLTSSVLLQPLNEMISTPIGASSEPPPARPAPPPARPPHSLLLDMGDQCSLYAEYLSDPYTEAAPSDRKSCSESASPLRTNKTQFSSTDNVREDSATFTFSTYFGSSHETCGSDTFDALLTADRN